jgi:hypothetical protein
MIPLSFPETRFLIRAPARSQFNAIEASLARQARERSRLGTKITVLQNRLALLTDERRLLNEVIETHEFLLAPIRQLSPEVLQEIFVFCLPVAHNAVMSAQEAPLLLCHICRAWRQLAHATPHLWTSIHIPLCHDIATTQMPSPEDVISWFARSKSLQLSISFYFRHPLSYISPLGIEQFKPYLDGIASVANRCRAFHTSLASLYIFEHLFLTNGDEWNSLEEFHIDSMFPPDIEEEDDIDSDWMPPKLRSLSLPFNGFMTFQPNADYKRLTELGITRASYGTYELGRIVEILLAVPLLRNLSISGFYTSVGFGSSPFLQHAVHLSHLESLSITDYQPRAHIWAFLRVLHTPRLRHWKHYLTLFHRSAKEYLTALSIFLSRLEKPLEELDLHTSSCSTNFREVLGLLPGLKRLSLGNPHGSYSHWFEGGSTKNIGDFHLSCLTEGFRFDWESGSDHTFYTDDDIASLPSTIYCPRLEVIKCVCHGQSLSESMLLDFLRFRTGSGAKAADITPLKKVDIFTESPISDGLQENVHQLLDGTGTSFRLLSAPAEPFSSSPSEYVSLTSWQPVYNPIF